MMKDLYLIGSLPQWAIVLATFAIVGLLVQQFIGLHRRLPLPHSSAPRRGSCREFVPDCLTQKNQWLYNRGVCTCPGGTLRGPLN